MAFVEPTKFTWVTDSKTGKQVKKANRETRWKARFRDPSGAARSQTFDRKFDAEQFLERNGNEIQQNEWIAPERKRTRFDEWADAWWETTVKLAPSTRRGYERNLRLHIRPTFDGRVITQIDWMEVELFVAKMVKGGSSPKTITQCVSILSLIMKTAMRAKVIKENPADSHNLAKRRKRPSVLTMHQVHRLVDHTDLVTSRPSGCSSSPGYAPRSYVDLGSAMLIGNATRSRLPRYKCGSPVNLS